MDKVLAKLSEKHPRESVIAKKLLDPFRFSAASMGAQWANGAIGLSRERADDLEMKICEALVEVYCRGVEAP